ncbi:MAG: hypothetical protein K2I42_03310 [Anaeroplasmataceae bacterium]|nr:hypothetical protein [Anaeroplasmataceae bacterium]
MELKSPNQESYYLNIDVLKDIDTAFFTCEVDGVEKSIPISNQGHYALYLGQFKSCKYDESSLYTISLRSLHDKYEKAIKSYSLSLLQTMEEESTKESLYIALPQEPTERIYHIFRRLLCMIKKAILQNDLELKMWAYQEVKKQQAMEYSGLANYKGNWWIYEIGIPRCLNEILVLCYDEINKEELCYLLAIENFYIPQAEYEYYRRNYPDVKRRKTDYANLADTIYICLLRSILLQDSYEIDHLASLLPEILKITNEGNGFYPDGSFLYHQSVPYNASYGEVLLHSLVKNLELFYWLEWDVKDYMDTIFERVEKAYFPFLYHQRALDCVRGRASSRVAGSHYSYQRIMKALHSLAKLYSRDGFIDHIYNEEAFFDYSSKAYAFQYMNRYIKRNDEFLIAISACSDTVSNYESINGENLLGSYQSNFTYELYYNQPPKGNEVLKINPFYRNGSTNPLLPEEPNQIMNNLITAGVAYKDILNTCFHQKNKVEGYFSKFVLKNSLVGVASDIHSNTEYISTIFTFEDNYSLVKNVLETDEVKLIFKTKPEIKRFIEERSYYDLNKNESDEKQTISQMRVFYINPNEYEYQLYPKKMCVIDEYQFKALPGTHILEYKNMILWNSFEQQPIKYKEICVQGRASLIFVYKENLIEVHFTSNLGEILKINILGYVSDIQEENIIIKDKLSHSIKFWRKI